VKTDFLAGSLGAMLLGVAASAGAEWQPLPPRGAEFAYTPSPSDWRDVPIYLVITDRFFDGDAANNDDHPEGVVNPYGADTLHGGDFRGVERKLDYIGLLGAKAIWISPVALNVAGAYHGYHAQDFNAVDPHWGTLDDLRSLVDAAHARGIYVILDVVFNHLGRLLASDDPGYPRFNPQGYRLRWATPDVTFAPPFDQLDRFHPYGNIEDWNDLDQYVRGSLRGLADLCTERPDVRDDLLRSYAALIAATDCDGFRVDTARHVEPDFWDVVLPGLTESAAALGKSNFLLLAEVLRYADSDVAVFTRSGRFNSALYCPLQHTIEDVFVRGKPTRFLTDRLHFLADYGMPARQQLVAFVDGHDTARVLNAALMAGNQDLLKTALTFLFTGPFVPCVYYGTEQGFDGEAGHTAREDMFDGEFEFGPSLGDNFDVTHELYRFIRRLALIRRQHAAFRRGSFVERWHDWEGRGGYVFSRKLGKVETVVAFNTSSMPRPIVYDGRGPEVGLPEGTRLVDLLHPEDRYVVGEGGGPNRIRLDLPAYGCVILVPEAAALALPPSAVRIEPAHGRAAESNTQPVVVSFDSEMDRDSVAQRLTISPSAAGLLSWKDEGRTIVFAPEASWVEGQAYTVRLGAGSRSKDGREVDAAVESLFVGGPKGGRGEIRGTFMLDGRLDEGAVLLGEVNGVQLFARCELEEGMLYVAMTDAGEGNDHFILIDDDLDAEPVHPAPWGKAGRVASDGPVLADENDSNFCGWRRVTGTARAKTGVNGGVAEGVLNLREQYGRLPEWLYLAALPYQTGDNGWLADRWTVPEQVQYDGMVGPNEYIGFNLLTGEIESTAHPR